MKSSLERMSRMWILESESHRSDLLLLMYYAEYARQRLREFISHKYTRGQNTLVVLLLAPEILHADFGGV